MRILLATDHYPPFIGGAHRQAWILARELRRRGHVVHVAAPWQKGEPQRREEDGVVVHRVRELRTASTRFVRGTGQRHTPPYPDPLLAWQLRRVIRTVRPDLIHTYGWMSFSCAAALLGMRIPLLVSARDYAYFCANRTLVIDGRPCAGPSFGKCVGCAGRYYGQSKGFVSAAGVALSRSLLVRKMSGLHSISGFVQEMTRDHLVAPMRGQPRVDVVIPSFHAVHSALGNGSTPALNALPSEPFILFVGAFRKVKGLETLFEAYGRLSGPPRLVLIGTVERDSPKVFPRGAIVLTDLPNAGVMAAWRRALFGVFPSLWPEPLGGVVFEAMSCGKAVIGTDHGGHADLIVDGSTGLLVPPADPDALARAMDTLIRDGTTREAYGRAALERSRLFAAETVVPQFERVYRRLAEDTLPRQ
jgi:glycosyltransferase involved in cell wall biosynthesis